MDLKQKIRSIPDFPKKGVVFRDITTLLIDGEAFKYSVDRRVEYWRGKKIDAVLGAEARGWKELIASDVHHVFALEVQTDNELCDT